MTGDARHEHYDVVVIGAGLGGLSAAAMLAASGRRVVVLEQGDAVGGYAHAFTRGSYTLDPAVHFMPQGGPGQVPDVVLRHLGVRDLVEFLPVDTVYGAHFPGAFVDTPKGIGPTIEAHARAFPHEAAGIRAFFELASTVHLEAHGLPPQIPLKDLDRVAAAFPNVFRYQKSTVADVADELLSDDRAKAACAAGWPFPGLPPSRCSFLTYSQVLMTSIDGAYYCRGSFQRFADALATAVHRHDGDVVLGSEVTRIVVADGRATGVETADGRRISADIVISNADARRTLLQMVGEEHLPTPFARRLSRMTPALSAAVVFAATHEDLSGAALHHETVVYPSWDHEDDWRAIEDGRPGGTWLSVPSLVDPSVAPAGEHVLVFSSLARYDIGRPWSGVIDGFAEDLVARYSRVIPELRSGLEIIDRATPLTIERFCRNQSGAIYGWANTPAQSASKRLNHQTPVENLYISGHWTQPGSGSLRAFVSGVHTSIMIMLAAGETPPTLNATDMLPPVR